MQCKTTYRCDSCGREYSTEIEAIECESESRTPRALFDVGDLVEVERSDYDGGGYSDYTAGIAKIVEKEIINHEWEYGFTYDDDFIYKTKYNQCSDSAYYLTKAKPGAVIVHYSNINYY